MRTRQKLFVEEYLRCWNASEAARRAGYSPRSAASIGWENLRKPEIKQEIDRRIEEELMSVNEVLVRLAQQARAEYSEYIAADGSLDLERLKADGKAHLVKSIKRTRYGIQVEFYNAQSALLQIARYHGLFNEKAETHTRVTFTREDVEEAHRLLAEFDAEMRQKGGRPALETAPNEADTSPDGGKERP